MLLSELQRLFARDTALLFKFIDDHNLSFTYGEAMRSAEQAEIYVKSGKGIEDSLHCKRLAIDINLFSEKGEYLNKTEDYQALGQFWENLSPSNRWGGSFKSRKDGNHFERNDKATK